FAQRSLLQGDRGVQRERLACTPALEILPTFFLPPAIRSLIPGASRLFSGQAAFGKTRSSCGFPGARNVCRRSAQPNPEGAEGLFSTRTWRKRGPPAFGDNPPAAKSW